MRIEVYDGSVAGSLKDKFLREKLTYGAEYAFSSLASRKTFWPTGTFSSLVTPTSTCITQKEKNDLMEDLRLLWDLYKVSNELYLASLSGAADPKIVEMAENGLSAEEIQIQRDFARARFEAKFCRVDYISLGEGRKLAEVQWKSGGPGLLLGIQEAFSELIPFGSGIESFGSPIDNYRNMIANGKKGQVAAVNDVGVEWANGEYYLARKYADSNLFYVPVIRDSFSDYVKNKDGELLVSAGGRTQKVDFFYLFLSPFSKWRVSGDKNLFIAIVKNCLDGKTWIEAPLNYIYRAKWQLALPFMKEFAHLFSDRLRKILPPTVLLDQKLDLRPIIEYLTELSDREKQVLASLTSIEDIAALGESLRKKLIVKCAASCGPVYYGSKGVYRLTGGKKSLKPTIDFIRQRLAMGEPWIVQPFVSIKYDIPLYMPENLNEPHNINAHARFMIFGGKEDNADYLIGGLGNYGLHWKVTGNDPRVDSSGNIYGTAFNDIRVEKDIKERTKFAEFAHRDRSSLQNPITCTKNRATI